jgi:hypothetical protein
MSTLESDRRRRPVTSPTSKVGVFICGSDGRRDVLERVLPSIFKYWPDCPYPIYVGLNSNIAVSERVTAVVAKCSDWSGECLEQVAQLDETHLIVVLDDYLFQTTVDQNRLSLLVDRAMQEAFPYLRLLPLRRSILERLVNLIRGNTLADIQAIKQRRPFYSGLQIAIWDKAHFMSLLELRGSIWDFEHQIRSDANHYVITGNPPIAYSHLVEKGRWLPYARSLLSQAGLPTDLGSRAIWPKWMHLRQLLDEVRFHVVGYANH